jgi:hypothetical protein
MVTLMCTFTQYTASDTAGWQAQGRWQWAPTLHGLALAIQRDWMYKPVASHYAPGLLLQEEAAALLSTALQAPHCVWAAHLPVNLPGSWACRCDGRTGCCATHTQLGCLCELLQVGLRQLLPVQSAVHDMCPCPHCLHQPHKPSLPGYNHFMMRRPTPATTSLPAPPSLALTLAPICANVYARLTAVVDLPTPPLQLDTAMMWRTPARPPGRPSSASRGLAGWEDRRTSTWATHGSSCVTRRGGEAWLARVWNVGWEEHGHVEYGVAWLVTQAGGGREEGGGCVQQT